MELIMKRTKIIVMASLIAFAGIGSIAAHGHDGGHGGNGWGGNGRHGGAWGAMGGTAAEAVKVTGTLQLVDGQIVIVSGSITYITHDIQRLVGFIEGLKEGATVKVEGEARAVPVNPNARFLRVSKLSVGGKDYNLNQNSNFR
ncbi:MAG: hypothetical protein Ta2G_03970 [Termitinemataceae bacterium]|nr:MAG: hypothetical protein Ta2G_03970 [Termitinemataceae bacterium]